MTLNDQIQTWLAAQGVTSTDYRTGAADGEPESILYWGADLPAQPTAEALAAAWATASLAQAKAAQVQVINDACQAALATITAPYPPSEALTWDQQLAEAQAYTANNSASTPMLSAICAASGKALAELAARVLALNAQFKAAVGAAIGKRQSLTAQIKAATTVEEVQAIAW